MIERIDLPELRSPVRLNDQYTVFERRIPDAGIDLDRDGKRDPVDVAMYVVIAGEEAVSIHNLRDAQAVKVNTITKLRAQYSGSSAYSEVVTTTETRWYIAGVGIVKASLAFDASEQRYDEELVTWDGVTSGIGPSELTARDLPPPISAVAFDQHAVVLTSVPSDRLGYGFRLSHLDAHGTVLASRDYPEPASGYVPVGVGQSLVRLGERVLFIGTTWSGLVMHSFDATGQSTTGEPRRLTDDGIPRTGTDKAAMKVASDGTRLWVLWQTFSGVEQLDPYTPYSDVKLQSFDQNGAPLREPIILRSGAGTLDDFDLSVSSARVIASWKRKVFDAAPIRWYAVIDQESDNPPIVRTLGALAHNDAMVKPVALGKNLGLMWDDAALRPSGVTLDASYDPMLGSATSLTDVTIQPDWFPDGGPSWIQSPLWLATAVDGNSVLTLTGHVDRLWPLDRYADTAFLALVEWTPGAGPWSSASARLVSHLPPINGMLLPFPNHVLVLSSASDRLQTMTVWRRP